jgi:hypothetical protein
MADIQTGFYTQANPNALLGTAQAATGIRGQQINNAQAQQNVVTQQVQYLAGGLGILAKKPDLSQADMVNFANGALKEGIISPQTYQAEMQNVQAVGNDPGKLQQLATNYAQRALDAGSKFTSTFGAPTTISTGSNTVAGVQNPMTGVFTPGSAIQQNMAPSDANSLVTITMPDGSTRQVTKAQSVQMLGANGNPLTAQGAPAAGNALTGQTSAPVPLAPLPSSQDTGPGISAPSPQQQAMFSQSGAQYQAAKNNDANYQANLVPLEKSLALLKETPLVGQGAAIPTDVANVLNTFGVNIGSDQAKGYAELNKYLTQVARNSGAADKSIPQLEAAFGSNPNVDMNKPAIQDVLGTLVSLQRMQHAIVANADAQGIKPEGYSDFARRQGSSLDPRAFGVDLMDANAKANLLKELEASPAAKARFAQSLRVAAQAGVLGDGNGQ